MRIRHYKLPVHDRAGAVIAHALISPEDWETVCGHRWHLTQGYVRMTMGHKKVLLHRLLLGLEHGDKRQGDHISRDKLDCRRSNLRIVTQRQNGQNKPPQAGHASMQSRYRGVYWVRDRSRWRAQAKLNGRMHRIGDFHDEDDAGAAARAWRLANMPYAVD
jgi:hypothetical protein